MHIQALRSEIGLLSPDSRYALAALALQFEEGDTGWIRRKALADKLAMPLRNMRGALTQLTCENLIVESSSKSSGRTGQGHLCRYALANEQIRALKSGPSGRIPERNRNIIRHLLSFPEVREVAAGKDDEELSLLSVSNRLLLAVLICHANVVGVVTDLGLPRLGRLTGLNTQYLNKRLQRLRRYGFIRSWVPGLSNSFFAGSKVHNTYFLNLHHPQLRQDEGGGGVLVLTDAEAASWIELGSEDETVRQLLLRLRGLGRQQLQWRLSRQVSKLLSENWQDLRQADQDHSVMSFLGQRVKIELSGELRRPPEMKEEQWERGLGHFRDVVLERAVGLVKQLEQLVRCDFADFRMQLIPTPTDEGLGRVTTLIMDSSPVPTAKCIALSTWGDPGWNSWISFWRDEQEISLSERVLFGLYGGDALKG